MSVCVSGCSYSMFEVKFTILSNHTPAHYFLRPSCNFFHFKIPEQVLTNHKFHGHYLFSKTKKIKLHILRCCIGAHCNYKPHQQSWCSGKLSWTRFLFLVLAKNHKTAVKFLERVAVKIKRPMKKVSKHIFDERHNFHGEKEKTASLHTATNFQDLRAEKIIKGTFQNLHHKNNYILESQIFKKLKTIGMRIW